jgi:hypothetical protein
MRRRPLGATLRLRDEPERLREKCSPTCGRSAAHTRGPHTGSVQGRLQARPSSSGRSSNQPATSAVLRRQVIGGNGAPRQLLQGERQATHAFIRGEATAIVPHLWSVSARRSARRTVIWSRMASSRAVPPCRITDMRSRPIPGDTQSFALQRGGLMLHAGVSSSVSYF